MKVAITTTTFGQYSREPLDFLAQCGLEVVVNPHSRKLKPDELVEICKNAVGVIAGTETWDAKVISLLGSLKVISRCGVGIDNIDIESTKSCGIKVYSTPDAPTRAVAELTIGLILDCLRRISSADRSIRAGNWEKPMGESLSGKKLGIIGFGRIGKEVALLAQAFGAQILAYDIQPVTALSAVKVVSFDELISQADIVSLHVPVGKKPGFLLDAGVLARMKRGAYIINTSRGGLVDEHALYAALRAGRLTAAGIDTFTEEPYLGNLRELDNVVLTSHIGSYARESRIAMEKNAARNLYAGLKEVGILKTEL